MTRGHRGRINVAIAGVGNCASALVEGLAFYRQNPRVEEGLLFPELCGYEVTDIDIVAAFDVARAKVDLPIARAIYQPPNQFVRIEGLRVESGATVLRGPTLDGNPPHLAKWIEESPQAPVDVSAVLAACEVDVLVNLLPTGSIEATEFYARAALAAGCAFINAIPTLIAQKEAFQDAFAARRLPLLGDDIKSQLGTTILHRALLALLESRGSSLEKTSQVNIGGNTDFANFVHRAETKLVSKRKSLARYVNGAACHVGHHYDPTRGPWKHALIEIETRVFGGSLVKLAVALDSDDKPNSAGSLVDLLRIARGALDHHVGGVIEDACAFYTKSPPVEMSDAEALASIRRNWARELSHDVDWEGAGVCAVDT